MANTIIASNNALMLEKSTVFSSSCDHGRCCIIHRKFVSLSNSKSRSTSSTAVAAAAAGGGSTAAAGGGSSSSSTVQNKEDIVIVGAGIAGLATAFCLHRLGIGSVVLEQAESLRTGGTSLTLFKNGWGVLDVMGVANELRPQFLEIQGMVVKTADQGRELLSFKFKDADKRQEVRAVERRILLQTLAHQLPPNTIRFSSKLSNIQKSQTDGETILQLTDGTRLSAKIVIGCDGIRSPIATWMGFRIPNYVGYSAIRGLAHYPQQGQPLPPTVTYIYGKGLRVGYVPVSTTKVYWFICYNTPSPPKPTSPSYLKSKALSLLQTSKAPPPQLLNLISSTPDTTISDTPIQDRWLWPITSPPVYKDNVVLVGDAWHPMTPNLGQGGCCALEDALVLANKIYGVLRRKGGRSNISDGFEEYGKERWKRLFGMTVRANAVGSLLQWENPVVCAVRDLVVVPNFVRVESLLEHTNFEIHDSLDGSLSTTS